MSSASDNELLSAYLDGELPADERARVEAWLARDPQAQRLLDELRAVSASLQSLPRAKLGDDLADAVLAAAERRILTGEDAAAEAPRPFARRLLKTLTNRRALAWAAVAAVIGVAIMVSERDAGQRARQVALAPPAADLPAAAPAVDGDVERAAGTADTGGNRDVRREEGRVLNAAPGNALQSRVLEMKAAPDTSIAASQEGAKSPAPSAAPAPRDDSRSGKRYYEYGAPARGGQTQLPSDAGVATGAARDSFGENAGARLAKEDAPESPSDLGRSAESLLEPYSLDDRYRGGANPQLLVVRCDVPAETVQGGAFDRVLASNSITLLDSAAPSSQGQPMLHPQGPSVELRSATGGRPSDRAGKSDRESLAQAPVELVYVEAAPAQIEATLRAIAADGRQFLGVQVEPAPAAPRQQSLLRFNRDTNGRAALAFDNGVGVGSDERSNRLPESVAEEGPSSFIAGQWPPPADQDASAAGGVALAAPSAEALSTAASGPQAGPAKPESLSQTVPRAFAQRIALPAAQSQLPAATAVEPPIEDARQPSGSLSKAMARPETSARGLLAEAPDGKKGRAEVANEPERASEMAIDQQENLQKSTLADDETMRVLFVLNVVPSSIASPGTPTLPPPSVVPSEGAPSKARPSVTKPSDAAPGKTPTKSSYVPPAATPTKNDGKK